MTRHELAKRVAWVLYIATIPLGLIQTAERWARIGGPWLAEVASQAGVRTEAGYFFGAVAGGFLALTVPPLAAGILGYVLGYVLGAALGRERGAPPAVGRELVETVGILPIWGIVFAPLSFVAVGLLPLLRGFRRWLGCGHPRGLLVARALFLTVVGVQFWLLATWAPLLPNSEVAIGVVAFAALIALLWGASDRTVGLVLLTASLVPAVAGPFAMPLKWRAVSFLAHAAVLLTPWLVLRARLVPEVGPVVLACFVCFTAFWGRLGQTAFMPSNEPLAEPVVTAAFRGESERIRSGAFFFTQPCAGWPLVAGSKERERGLVVFPPQGGASLAGMRFMASDNYAPDCPNDSVYVANFLEAKLYRLRRDETRPRGELGSLHLEPLPHRCPVRGPWWLILDRSGRNLYILDEQNEIAVADLASDECHLVATGEKLWDFVIDDDRGELVLGDAGRVRVLRKSDGAELDRIDLPGRWRGVVAAAHKTKVALAADGTLYAAYFNAGTVSKLRRDPLRIEAATDLERGVRLLLWDEARRTLYVGNRDSGALDALDGDSLAVLGHVHVGRRMRTFSLTPDGRSLLLGSVVGAVRVDLDRLVARGGS